MTRSVREEKRTSEAVGDGGKRRVRNEIWDLKETAQRRRKRANAMVIASLLGVVVLIRVFYVLLTR